MDSRSSEKQKLIEEMNALAERIGPIQDKDSARVTVHFARLLVILSQEAREATQETVRMHRWLIWLTWGLLALTFGLLVAAILPIIFK